jgi:hypothetical protein
MKAINELFSSTVKLDEAVIDRMTNNEIKVAAKSRGLWDSEKSWFQIRELLKNFDPTNIKEIDMAAKKNATKKVEKTSKAKKDTGPSKMDLALEFYKKNPKAERKDLIKHFVDKIGLTKAGASTYVTLVRAKLKI